MFVRPELQALRGDDAPQRRMQAALRAVREEWSSGPIGRQVEAELISFDNGIPIEDLPLLSCLFAHDDDGEMAAQSFVDDQIRPLIGGLAQAPLGQVPLGFSTDDVRSTLVLGRQGTTILSVQVIFEAGLKRWPEAKSISFAPVETHERVLFGSAAANHIVMRDKAGSCAPECTPIRLAAGDVRRRHGSNEALVFTRVFGSLGLFKLQRRLGRGSVTREHRLGDGQLIHQTAGCPNDSRLELTASLLGRMGRSDAAPLLAAMAEEDGSDSARWQALRECLSLDSAIGFASACHIASRHDDPLCASASALRAQLLEAYPELGGGPCRR